MSGPCGHINTIIWEPHLAGARKCRDCGMVYNPNSTPNWKYEKLQSGPLREITDEVWVDPSTIVSMEFETSNSYCGYSRGTTITLANGRKIYVRGMTPRQIAEKLK